MSLALYGKILYFQEKVKKLLN